MSSWVGGSFIVFNRWKRHAKCLMPPQVIKKLVVALARQKRVEASAYKLTNLFVVHGVEDERTEEHFSTCIAFSSDLFGLCEDELFLVQKIRDLRIQDVEFFIEGGGHKPNPKRGRSELRKQVDEEA